MGTVLIPELTRAVRADGSRCRRACGIARPRTRGRAGAAGHAWPDRAERADRAAAVRARRLHRNRHRGHRPRADVADAGAAGACAGEGAVAGVLRARGYADAADSDAEGRGAGDRGRIPARPLVRRRWHCRRDCAGGLEHGVQPDPQRRGDVWLFDRCRCEAAAAAHRHGGARDGGAVVACDTVLARARLGRTRPRTGRGAAHRDRSGNRDLRPVSAAFRRHRLARSG